MRDVLKLFLRQLSFSVITLRLLKNVSQVQMIRSEDLDCFLGEKLYFSDTLTVLRGIADWEFAESQLMLKQLIELPKSLCS